jgi:hypothetical protein
MKFRMKSIQCNNNRSCITIPRFGLASLPGWRETRRQKEAKTSKNEWHGGSHSVNAPIAFVKYAVAVAAEDELSNSKIQGSRK